MTEKAKKVDIRVKKTYNQLIVALVKLLAEKSFDDITVLEICETAGVHRATFYKHFVDKYDFLNTCCKLKLSELIFEKVSDDFIYSAQAIKVSCMMMLKKTLRFINMNKEMFVGVSHDNRSVAFRANLTESVANFIVERLHTIPKVTEELGQKTYMIANFYAGGFVDLIKWWLNAENPCSVQELMDFAEVKFDNLCKYFDTLLEE